MGLRSVFSGALGEDLRGVPEKLTGPAGAKEPLMTSSSFYFLKAKPREGRVFPVMEVGQPAGHSAFRRQLLTCPL